MGANFAGVGVSGIFDAFHYLGFERVSFFEQFIHTLGIRAFGVGQALQIPGLTTRARSESCRRENDGVHDLAFSARLFLDRARRFAASCFSWQRGFGFSFDFFFASDFFAGRAFLAADFFDFDCFFLVIVFFAIREVYHRSSEESPEPNHFTP